MGPYDDPAHPSESGEPRRVTDRRIPRCPQQHRSRSLMAPQGEASVSDLTAPLGLSQPTVSHHLRILTEAGLLERDKRGVWAYYRLVPSAIATIADLLTPPRKRAMKKTR
ncbi:ArsR/SmtB family transcription factor [Micromonospora marina]